MVMRQEDNSVEAEGNSCASSPGVAIIKNISSAQMTPMITENMICPVSAPNLKIQRRLAEDIARDKISATDIFSR